MVGYAMEAATLVYDKKFDREIRYDAGTDLLPEVRIPAKVATPAGAQGWAALTPAPDLVRLVNAQPLRVDTKAGAPVDVTNVMLLGSQEQVEAAFRGGATPGAAAQFDAGAEQP